jgi:hypothetical protein
VQGSRSVRQKRIARTDLDPPRSGCGTPACNEHIGAALAVRPGAGRQVEVLGLGE